MEKMIHITNPLLLLVFGWGWRPRLEEGVKAMPKLWLLWLSRGLARSWLYTHSNGQVMAKYNQVKKSFVK